MYSIQELKKIIKNQSISYQREIVGIWETKCIYNPIQNNRIFNCKFVVVQTRLGQGCAYSECNGYNEDYLLGLIEKDCIDFSFCDSALEVAYLDSLSEKISYGFAKKEIFIRGTSIDKLKKRSEIIVSEAEKLVGDLNKKRVLNVGVVGNIIYQFLEKKCEVLGSDFDPSIIGTTLFNRVPIESGKYTLDLLRNVDIAVVTGMTLATQTLDAIVKTCKENDIRLIVFAETGANMGQYYVNQGVDCYLGEKFPFYIFNGDSCIQIITRKK